jgi:hypothetical protein
MASDFPCHVTAYVETGSEVLDFLVSTTGGETAAKAGELMYFDTSTQTLKRCGADPALILGISEVASDFARTITPDNRIPIRVLKPEALVRMCSATTPAETHLLVAGFGIVRLASGNWAVDTSDTSNIRVQVKRIDIAAGAFFVNFTAANLQGDAIAS